MRTALRGDQVAVVESRVDGTTLGGRRDRIGGGDDHEGGDARIDERRGSRAGGLLTGPPDARVVAGEERTADAWQRRAHRLGLCEEGIAALLLRAVVVVVVAAVDAVVHRVGPARVDDRLERLRVEHRVLVGETQQGYQIALGDGGQGARQHHPAVGAVELAADRRLEQVRGQLARHPRAVGEREAHGDRCLIKAGLELVEDRAEVAIGILLALRAVIAHRERGVEDALELPCRAHPELRSGECEIDDAVDDHALEPLGVRGRVGLCVLGAVRLAVDADVRAAKPLAEGREILDCLARTHVRQERRGLQLGDTGVDEGDGCRLLLLLRVGARGGRRLGARETTAATDATLVEEDDVVPIEHRLRVAREIAVSAENAARTRSAGGDDEETAADLVRGTDGERHLDPAGVRLIEVIQRHGEFHAGEGAGRRAWCTAEGLECARHARTGDPRQHSSQQ